MVAERKARTSYAAGLATRDLILSTAMEMIAEYGYHGMTLRDLARRIGISHPAVIYHFPNKEAMVQAVILRFEEKVGLIDAVRDEETGTIAPVAVKAESWEEYTVGLMRLATREDVAQCMAFSAILEWEPVNADHPLYEYSIARRKLITEFMMTETQRMKDKGSWQFVVEESFLARTILTLWAGNVHQARSVHDREHNVNCIIAFLATAVVLLKISPGELLDFSGRVPEELANIYVRVMHHVSAYVD